MTTTDTTLLIILTSLLSLFFLLCIALVIMLLKLLSSVRRVIDKAEDVVDSVESAAEVFKDTQGRLALFKLIKNIVKLAQRSHKR
jgi:uncharacterized protein YoxC